ncbi:MAG: VWA domain-containing protein, partial [Thiotrichaceae bacterium]
MSDISLVLANLDWRQPLWLLVALQPLLLWLVVRWLQQHKEVLFADAHLLPWIQVRQKKTVTEQILSRNSAYGLAWILMALTLAGPRLPDDRLIDHNEINLDVMMVIDLSRSMHATDIQPSRLRRATLEAYEFLSLAKNTRVGIIVYAARAHLFVPLTKDHNALKFYLQDLDSLQLPTKGSNAKAAIQLAKDELQQAEKTNLQALLWLTDGDIELEDMVSM